MIQTLASETCLSLNLISEVSLISHAQGRTQKLRGGIEWRLVGVCIARAVSCGQHSRRVWGSASIQILYTYATSSGDIRYDNRSYAIVVQRKELCQTADFGTICFNGID